MDKDKLYISHILSAIESIEEFTRGLDHDNFLSNKLVQSAVIRQVEIIGEATKNLSESLRADESRAPWRDIAGMRDFLIHEYFGVDLEEVWKTVSEDVPRLKEIVKSLQ